MQTKGARARGEEKAIERKETKKQIGKKKGRKQKDGCAEQKVCIERERGRQVRIWGVRGLVAEIHTCIYIYI